MAIINVTPTGQTIKCKTDDVIILEGIETIKHNGFEVKYLHSETQSAFYVSPLGGKYIVGDKYFILEVSGETSEDHDLYEILGVTNRSEIDKVVWRDTKNFGGGSGSNFDPTKYYTKVITDETFATKEELYAWGHPEVPQGESSEANVNTLDTIKNVGRYSLAFDYKGNPLPSGDYAFLLVTRKVDNGDIRQEYSHINVNFEADTSTVMFAYRMYDTTKQEWSGWAVIDSVSGGDITETLKNYYTKKQADETFSTVLAHNALGTAITDLYNQKVGYDEIYIREESDARFALKGETGGVASSEYQDLKDADGNFVLENGTWAIDSLKKSGIYYGGDYDDGNNGSWRYYYKAYFHPSNPNKDIIIAYNVYYSSDVNNWSNRHHAIEVSRRVGASQKFSVASYVPSKGNIEAVKFNIENMYKAYVKGYSYSKAESDGLLNNKADVTWVVSELLKLKTLIDAK